MMLLWLDMKTTADLRRRIRGSGRRFEPGTGETNPQLDRLDQHWNKIHATDGLEEIQYTDH